MTKRLYKFEQPWQAEIFQGLLAQEGIRSFTIKGARPYMTILTGMGEHPTELFVEESDLQSAQKVLADYLRKTQLQLVDDAPVAEPLPKNHFNYVIFMSALGAVVIPIIFNLLATYHLVLLFRDQSVYAGKKSVAAFACVTGWGASLFLLYHFVF
jgi:hypothetical protein